MSLDSPKDLAHNGGGRTFAIVAARFNQRYVDAMLAECIRALTDGGVEETNIRVVRVPGSNEVPYATAMLARSEGFDCVIGLGLVVAGETPHHEVIAQSTGQAMQQIALEYEIPVINGIVVVLNDDQAQARCTGRLNRGREFGLSALEMAALGAELFEEFGDLLGMGMPDLSDLADLFDEEEEEDEPEFPDFTLLDGDESKD